MVSGKAARDVAGSVDAFYLPGTGPYVLSHSVGCLPCAARTALESSYLRPWMEKGGDAWDDWLRGIEEFRAGLAVLFGGAAADYCPQVNLSSGLAKFLGALPAPCGGKRVVLAAEDSFPSLGFVARQAGRVRDSGAAQSAQAQSARPLDCGSGLKLIPRARSPIRIESWEQALTDDVRAVLVTHVHSNTGEVAPVREIARLCAQRDVLCIVDASQSAGILPLSVAEWGAQVVLGSCVKWLCGGPGAGFMWISPQIIGALEPVDVGWYSHSAPFEFDIHHFEYAKDARRFWGGTPSVVPFVTAAASLRLIADIGVSTIHAHNRRLMHAFVGALPPAWRVRVRLEDIGGTLCIPVGVHLDAIRASLAAAGVRFDCRGSVVRLSFHIFNTVEDAARIASAWKAGARHP